MGPTLWVNAELVALQYLLLPVEICHSVYLRSTLIQGQPELHLVDLVISESETS